MFGKKKEKLPGTITNHYEGLPGFRQDFPCGMEVKENMVSFTNSEGAVVNLPIEKITMIDWMKEEQFMGKYHNNPVNTSKTNAIKWFSVISYNSNGEDKYIALWDVASKTRSELEKIHVAPQGEITL